MQKFVRCFQVVCLCCLLDRIEIEQIGFAVYNKMDVNVLSSGNDNMANMLKEMLKIDGSAQSASMILYYLGTLW